MIKLLLSLLFIFLLVGEPFARWWSFKRIIANMGKTPNFRLIHYYENILRYWLLCLYLAVVLYLGNFNATDLGFRPLNWQHFIHQPLWLNCVIVVIAVAFVNHFYFAPIIMARLREKTRIKVLKIIKNVKYIAPANPKEAFWWTVFSFNGVAEEILYRGFIFFYCVLMFPSLSLLWIVIISAAVEGWRFMPRYIVVANVAFAGLFYALLYMSFQSIYLVAVIHMMNYLKVFVLPFDDDQTTK